MNFATWNGSEWLASTTSPISPNSFENFPPALNSYEIQGDCTISYFLNIAYTLNGASAGQIEWTQIGESTYVVPFCKPGDQP